MILIYQLSSIFQLIYFIIIKYIYYHYQITIFNILIDLKYFGFRS